MIQSPFQRAVSFVLMIGFSVSIAYYGVRGVILTFQSATGRTAVTASNAVLFGMAALFGLMFLLGILMLFKVARTFFRGENLR